MGDIFQAGALQPQNSRQMASRKAINVYNAQIVVSGKSTRLDKPARPPIITSEVIFDIHATLNVISYGFACRLMATRAGTDSLQQQSVMGMVLVWDFVHMKFGGVFRTFHEIATSCDTDVTFARNWFVVNPVVESLPHSQLPPIEARSSESETNAASAASSAISIQEKSRPGSPKSDTSATKNFTISRQSTGISQTTESSQGPIGSADCGSSHYCATLLRSRKRQATFETEDSSAMPASKKAASTPATSVAGEAPEPPKDTSSSPTHSGKNNTSGKDTSSNRQASLPKDNAECTCNALSPPPLPTEWTDEGSVAHKEFLENSAHEYWTWSVEEENWYHIRKDGTTYWCPKEFD